MFPLFLHNSLGESVDQISSVEDEEIEDCVNAVIEASKTLKEKLNKLKVRIIVNLLFQTSFDSIYFRK